MAAEPARGKVVDTRADVWAFGCVLYERLAGRRAFGHPAMPGTVEGAAGGAGEEVMDLVAAVLTKEPDWTA